MNSHVPAILCVLCLGLLAGFGCSGGSDVDAPTPEAGTITAGASGITGQAGKMYYIAAFDYDWQPGATEPSVATRSGSVTDDDFSFEVVLYELDQYGQPTMTEKAFEPGVYSVVFFVGASGPPEYFVEVFVDVDGDVTAHAPAWGTWTHQRSP